jgi:uncharacterized YccA/Bax inhibitor family protein
MSQLTPLQFDKTVMHAGWRLKLSSLKASLREWVLFDSVVMGTVLALAGALGGLLLYLFGRRLTMISSGQRRSGSHRTAVGRGRE